MKNETKHRIEGVCADCNEEMDLVAADKHTGADWVCWQCATPGKDSPFFNVDGSLTKLGEAAQLQIQSDRALETK